MEVLIVDDIYENRYLLSVLLKDRGYQVTEAIHGKDALDKAYLRKPDVVISDILMPVMDGFELCNHWKSDKTLRSIPFIFYTATYTEPKDERLALALGADRFLIKPMDTSLLLNEVESLLAEYAAGEAAVREPAIHQEEYYQRYSVSLVKKLEDKLAQLDDRNRRLHDSERALRRMNQEVGQRLIEVKAAEKNARLAMKRFELAAEVGRVGVWEWNPEAGKVQVDGLMSDVFGLSGAGELDWDTFTHAFHVDDRVGLMQLLNQMVDRQETSVNVSCRMYDANGGVRWFMLRASRMNVGRGVRIVGANADITEQKQLEQQLSQLYKMEALGQLTSGIAHDFNNILASIIGYSELLSLEVGEGQETARMYIEQILQSGERASNLVNKLLAFGRNRESNFEVIDIHEPLLETVEMLRSTLPSTINLALHADNKNTPVLIDVTQLHQIIMNLCLNARDALQGRGTIDISLRVVSNNRFNCSACGREFSGDFVCLSVGDSGPGIPESVRKRIFDPFFTTKDADKGTGLGLSVVHGAVHNHNGHIVLKTVPEYEGTCFELYFPQAESVTASSAPTEDLVPQESYNGCVFVLDDEPSICFFLQEVMMEAGFDVRAFTSPLEMMAVLQADPESCDVLVSDQTMPEMLGTEVLLAARRLRPDLPVILCTGYSENLDEDMAMQVGANAFFKKPFNAQDLIRAVGRETAHRMEGAEL